MANDYIVRLQGQDNLSGTIQNVQRSIEGLGGSASRLDSIQRRFERIEQSSAPLRKKLKDVKAEMEKLAVTGDTSSELFQRMAQAAQRYQQALDQVNQATRSVDSVSNQMNSRLDNIRGMAGQVASSAGLGGIASTLGAIATPAGAAVAGVGAVAAVLVKAGNAAAEFETHLDSLQSLTGLDDSAMQAISKGAIEMSKSFSSSASDIVDSMKLIGSQAPELLSDKDALMEVTKAANVLSEAAQIEVVDAAKGITTVMNQMGVSASEASNIINTLAASSQQGSADVAYLNKAFEKAGTAAKGAGMNYVELSAAVEAIAPKFSSADVAGSQLASTLLKLSMQGNNDFKPAVVGMQQALENLAKAEMNDSQIKDLVGESNVTMLKSLMEAKDTFAGYTQTLAGTNTAYEQMAINNDNFEGKVKALKGSWEAFLINLGQSAPIQATMDLILALGEGLMEVVDCIMDVVDALSSMGDSSVISPMEVLKSTWDALVAIIKGCLVAIEIVIRAVAKLREIFVESIKNGCLKAWNGFKDSVSNIAWVQRILNGFKKIGDYFKSICDYILKLWNKMCDTLGMESKKVSIASESIKAEKVISTTENVTNNTTNNTTTSNSTTNKKSNTKSTKTEKIDYLVSVDDKSLDTAEKKLSAWTAKRKTLRFDDKEGLAECDANIKKWSDEVIIRKIMLTADGQEAVARIDEIKAKIAELEDRKVQLTTIEKKEEVGSTSKTTSNAVSNTTITNVSNNVVNSTTNQTTNRDTNETFNKEFTEIVIDDSDIKRVNDELIALKNELFIEQVKIGIKPEIEKGSINDINNELKNLEEAKKIILNTVADPQQIQQLEERVKQLKSKLESEQIRLGIAPELGSINNLKSIIKQKEDELQIALNTNLDAESLKNLMDELDALRKQEEGKEIELGIKSVPSIRKEESQRFDKGSIEDKKQSLSNASSMIEDIKQNYSLKLIGADEARAQIDAINAQLLELGLKPIELTINDNGTITTAMENLEAYKEKMSQVASVAGSVGSAFGNLGDAIGGTGGKFLELAGQSATAVSQMIPQIVALIGAKQGEALASGTASAAALPFPANIAAIASIIATITGLFASFAGAFADGGIVQGNSFHGDRMLARVNAGEMILNRKQQSNLFNALDSGGATGGMRNVTFTLSGSTLKGCLKNYESKMSKLK